MAIFDARWSSVGIATIYEIAYLGSVLHFKSVHSKPPSMSHLHPFPLGLMLVILLSGCRVTDLRLWRPDQSTLSNAYDVEQVRGVQYREGAGSQRRRLDLFLPKGKRDFPVVVLLHGGAWMIGDNRCCGLYSSVGEFLASQGIGAVLPNYRLSPWVRHPAHVEDAARVVAWTRNHIAERGGRPDQIFLAGHSAGGHLVSLLATDEQYLKAEGLQSSDVRGVIALSGVYGIPPGNLEFTWGGSAAEAFHWDEIAPLRATAKEDRSRKEETPRHGGPSIPLSLNVFGPAFGNDPKTRAAASPLRHVRPGLPPFLILSPENELPTLAAMADDFHAALLNADCDSQLLRLPGRNHNSIMFQAMQADDPAARAILDFIRWNVDR